MDQKKMIPFVTEYSEPTRALQFGQDQIMQSLTVVNANVLNASKCVTDHLQTMEKKLQNAERKKRKSCVSEGLAFQNNGKIVLVENYDDETQDVKEFAYNLKGRWRVARIAFRKVDIKECKYIILFPEANIWIVGDIKKNSGKNLHEAFVKAGVIFAPDNSVSKIQRILFAAFGSEIDRTQAVYYFPELAGWNEGKFLYAEKCNYEKRLDFPELPVMKKHFTFLRGNKRCIETYFNMLRNITHWQERLLLLEMPILGLLASIYAEEGRKIDFALNLVSCDNTPLNELIYAMQIFNRDQLFSIDAGAAGNYIRDILKEANDELIIVDATGEGSSYLKKKQQDNVQHIIRKICHEGNNAFGIIRDINASLLIFNNSRILQEDVINLMLSKDIFQFKASVEGAANQIVAIYFSEFIVFAERRIEELRAIIRKTKGDRRGNLLSGWNILHLFCNEQGIDLSSAGGFPGNIDMGKLLERFDIPDDLTDIVKGIIRKEIQHWSVIEKCKQQKYVFSACYYDEKFLWIPTKILDRMLAREGMLPYKLNALYEMKKTGNLQTDPTGLSSRVQIGGNRIEAYKFRRSCFSMTGEADIVDLGKEMTSHVDG